VISFISLTLLPESVEPNKVRFPYLHLLTVLLVTDQVLQGAYTNSITAHAAQRQLE
jgi:hypothetical protein